MKKLLFISLLLVSSSVFAQGITSSIASLVVPSFAYPATCIPGSLRTANVSSTPSAKICNSAGTGWTDIIQSAVTSITGTANQITVTGTTTPVLSLPSTIIAPGTFQAGVGAIGATSTDGFILSNSTAAAASAQQYSPRLRFTGQGWKTNATAASQIVDWIVENTPVEGAAAPTSRLSFKAQINAGGYSEKAYMGSNGELQMQGSNPILKLVNTAGGSGTYFQVDSGQDVYFWNAANTNMYFGRNNATAFSLTSAGLNVAAGGLNITTAGQTVQIKTGSNACAGSSTLSSGTVTVSTTCTGTTWGTDFIILLTPRGSSTGTLRVSTHTAATSFVITSTDAASSDPVGWLIIKQN